MYISLVILPKHSKGKIQIFILSTFLIGDNGWRYGLLLTPLLPPTNLSTQGFHWLLFPQTLPQTNCSQHDGQLKLCTYPTPDFRFSDPKIVDSTIYMYIPLEGGHLFKMSHSPVLLLSKDHVRKYFCSNVSTKYQDLGSRIASKIQASSRVG